MLWFRGDGEGEDCKDGTERSMGCGDIFGDRTADGSVTLAAGCNSNVVAEGSHATEVADEPGDAGCEAAKARACR